MVKHPVSVRIVSVELPSGAQKFGVQFHWWQPHHLGSGQDLWALDEISITSVLFNTISLDFSNMLDITQSLGFYLGHVQPYCLHDWTICYVDTYFRIKCYSTNVSVKLVEEKFGKKVLSKFCTNKFNGNRNLTASAIEEKYKVGKVIGDGNFAVVKECVERSSGKEFALKIIDKNKCRGKEHLIESEVAVLRQVKHPNIIMLIEEVEMPSELYLVMELVKGGDLFDAITSSTKYTEKDASTMIKNLASALKYLHRMNIVHRDIKPENLLNKAAVDNIMKMEVTGTLKKHFTSAQKEGNTNAGVSVIMNTALDKGKLQLCHRSQGNSATLPQEEEGHSGKKCPSSLSADTKSSGVTSLQALNLPSSDAPPMSSPQCSEEPGDERVFEREE
ncbi:Serine/threonine-protein kinase DCLK1 [Bagarius yarrelli]|uniref:Serine/threonine-protein kinase DCLK1 n=1 Tax=Bagarius yarrelli TaxID=175774 RepID=A0A556VW14_BAGYA|nr:Serine/threonine-protein kinase DCLK1 [Bagarius yarrelli]